MLETPPTLVVGAGSEPAHLDRLAMDSKYTTISAPRKRYFGIGSFFPPRRIFRIRSHHSEVLICASGRRFAVPRTASIVTAKQATSQADMVMALLLSGG